MSRRTSRARRPLRMKRLPSARCCGKRSYATQEVALRALALIEGTSPDQEKPRRVYRCENGWWHLTKRASFVELPRTTLSLILQRDDLRCFCCGTPLRDRPYRIHLRRRPDGTPGPQAVNPANLILLAGDSTGCHGRVEQRTDADHAAGYWLLPGEDPETTPARHWRLGPVLLASDGSLTPAQTQQEASDARPF